jgi:outer membrane protein assembly factor BamB
MHSANFRVGPSLVLAGALLALTAQAVDWPQYRGPQANGKTDGELARSWEASPKPLWKVPTTKGFSVFSVGEGKAFTLLTRELGGAAREVCVALDSATGKELWAAPLGLAKYDGGGDSGEGGNDGGDGPRSTPSVQGSRVYVLDARLKLYCLEAASGREAWTKDLVADLGAKVIQWQNAASPVVDGDLIFVCCGAAGQSLLGINRLDGAVVWKGEDDTPTHATPIVATILGTRQAIFLTQKGLVSAEARTGKVLWRHAFRFSVSTAASPVVSEDIVYCSAGYGVGSTAVRLAKADGGFSVTPLWRTEGNKIANHWSTPVARNGFLYGMFSFKEYGRGALKCVEVATGKEIWSQLNFGAGGVILVGDLLLALSDRGQLILIDPSPEGYKELGRVQAVAGKCWNNPTFSDGRVYVRSTQEGACLNVGAK